MLLPPAQIRQPSELHCAGIQERQDKHAQMRAHATVQVLWQAVLLQERSRCLSSAAHACMLEDAASECTCKICCSWCDACPLGLTAARIQAPTWKALWGPVLIVWRGSFEQVC